MRTALRLTALSLALTAMLGCGRKQEADLLAYVPADTPYVIATLEAMPPDVQKAYVEKFYSAMLIDQIGDNIVNDLEQANAANPDDPLLPWLKALLPELMKSGTPAKLAEWGFPPSPKGIFYGHGLVPVLRMELSDPARFDAFLDDLATRAGRKFDEVEIDGNRFRSFGNEQVKGYIGTLGQQAVMSLMPARLPDEDKATLLGLELPDASLADRESLEALRQQHGFLAHNHGYIDFQRLARLLTAPQASSERAIFEALQLEVPQLGPECAKELEGMVALAPRLVFGTMKLDLSGVDTLAILETEAQLTQDLKKLRGPVPGTAIGNAGLLQTALGLNVPETVKLFTGAADKVLAAPYQCDKLAPINQSAAELKQELSNPGLAMAGSVTGLHLLLQDFSLDTVEGQSPQLSAALAVASPTPVMLWGFAQASLPPLAKVNMTMDGQVIELPESLVPGPVPLRFKAVMHKDSIAFGTADVADDDFLKLSQVDANAVPPLLQYGISGRFFGLLADDLSKSVPSEGAGSEESAETIAAVRKMENVIERIDVRIGIGESGVEIHQQVSLKP